MISILFENTRNLPHNFYGQMTNHLLKQIPKTQMEGLLVVISLDIKIDGKAYNVQHRVSNSESS